MGGRREREEKNVFVVCVFPIFNLPKRKSQWAFRIICVWHSRFASSYHFRWTPSFSKAQGPTKSLAAIKLTNRQDACVCEQQHNNEKQLNS